MHTTDNSRRRFLKALGVMGLGISVCGVRPLTADAARFPARPGEKLYKTSQTRMLMGTFVSVTVVHQSKDLGQEAVGRTFDEMKRLIRVFDRHDPATAVSVLNDRGRLDNAPAELVDVTTRAKSFNALSSGNFDATVAPLVDLYKRRADQGKSLDIPDKELAEVMELVDSSAVQVGSGLVAYEKPGMGLTLDGIAKGYIVDRASEMLSAMGVHNHLINAGGDIRTSGERGSGKPWTVAVEDPQKGGDYPDVLHVRNCAMATSGNYEIFYDENKAHSHLVSPKSGRSPLAVAGATVTAPTVMEADALSTALCLMPLDKGANFIYSLPGRESLVIASSGALLRSKGWNGKT